jgi:hypothetical protein
MKIENEMLSYILGVNIKTLQNWRSLKKDPVPHLKEPHWPYRIYYKSENILKWLEQNRPMHVPHFLMAINYMKREI